MKIVVALALALTLAGCSEEKKSESCTYNGQPLSCDDPVFTKPAPTPKPKPSPTPKFEMLSDSDYEACVAEAQSDFNTDQVTELCLQANSHSVNCIKVGRLAKMEKTDIVRTCKSATVSTSECILQMTHRGLPSSQVADLCQN